MHTPAVVVDRMSLTHRTAAADHEAPRASSEASVVGRFEPRRR